MTVSGLVNYFGHRHVTNTFIAQDMRNDSRNYAWVHSTVYPNTFSHEVSDQYSSYWSGPMIYDSINTSTEAMEKNGKLHKATTRLTVGYVIDSSGFIRAALRGRYSVRQFVFTNNLLWAECPFQWEFYHSRRLCESKSKPLCGLFRNARGNLSPVRP
jgi:hypothetical protein